MSICRVRLHNTSNAPTLRMYGELIRLQYTLLSVFLILSVVKITKLQYIFTTRWHNCALG